jgi:hypothetical protein
MFNSLISTLSRNFTNARGWRTNRKIIVFESDDWGSMRMPSNEAINNLEKQGILLKHSKYATLDTLENKSDILDLCEVLMSNPSSSHQIPVFTTNMVLGNPDYSKIKANGFDEFHWMNLWSSYNYFHGENLKKEWQDAIRDRVFFPQYHATTHLNHKLWMRDLKSNRDKTVKAFKERFYGLIDGTSSVHQKNYLMEFYAENSDELIALKKHTKEGLKHFEKLFGYRSTTFVACNYVMPQELESTLYESGVRMIQTQRGHLQPLPLNKNKKYKIVRHFTGQKSKTGIVYSVRNIKFEPFDQPHIDWVSKTLNEIGNAFKYQKPAVISTHRINYVGGLNLEHKERNLKSLDELLKRINHKWPDVEYLNSAELSHLMNS